MDRRGKKRLLVLCAPARFRDSLGSGTMTLRSDDGAAEAAIRRKVRDLRTELAVWCGFYGLRPEWFSAEELERALAYTQTEDYGGSPVYLGAWNLSDPENKGRPNTLVLGLPFASSGCSGRGGERPPRPICPAPRPNRRPNGRTGRRAEQSVIN